MLEYDDFKKVIKKQIKDCLSLKYQDMQMKDVVRHKNNRSKEGFCIHHPEKINNALCMYYDDLYERYLEQDDLESLLKETLLMLIKALEELKQMEKGFDIRDLESLKKCMICQMIHTETNRELLSEVPHREFLDLSVICRLVNLPFFEKKVTVVVTNQLLNLWEITEAELINMALQNTKENYSISLCEMREMLEERDSVLEGSDWRNEEPLEKAMFCLTNKDGLYGANAFLFPKEFQKLAKKLNSDLAIFPSSIHELIVVAGDKRQIAEQRCLVESINQCCVDKEEQLSNQMYWYCKDSQQIMIAEA